MGLPNIFKLKQDFSALGCINYIQLRMNITIYFITSKNKGVFDKLSFYTFESIFIGDYLLILMFCMSVNF